MCSENRLLPLHGQEATGDKMCIVCAIRSAVRCDFLCDTKIIWRICGVGGRSMVVVVVVMGASGVASLAHIG